MAKYTFFWRDGKRQVLEGKSAVAALNSAGYGNGALRALDVFSVGDNNEWQWSGSECAKEASDRPS